MQNNKQSGENNGPFCVFRVSKFRERFFINICGSLFVRLVLLFCLVTLRFG